MKLNREQPSTATRPKAASYRPIIFNEKTHSNSIYILLICAALTACHIDANAILNAENGLTLYIHSRNAPAIQADLPKGSQLYNEFREWFLKNEEGWSISSVTYIPSIEVRGKKFNINFLGTSAIVNYQDSKGSYHQYVKDVKPEENRFLNKK